MKLAWLTDIHLDFLDESGRATLIDKLSASEADAFVITGDICNADSIENCLRELESGVCKSIYFVLGNHDFYGASIRTVRKKVASLSARSRSLVWLPAAGVVALSDNTALIGHEGFCDVRIGNTDTTPLLLNDFFYIEELAGLRRQERNLRMRELADESAAHIREMLAIASAKFQNIIVLTHIPPFREACWHEGRISDDNWLPYFTCSVVGEVLRYQATRFPERHFLVLCGHTHGSGEVAIMPNLRVLTGAAEYGKPRIEQFIDVK